MEISTFWKIYNAVQIITFYFVDPVIEIACCEVCIERANSGEKNWQGYWYNFF